jgi:hypothetical protein
MPRLGPGLIRNRDGGHHEREGGEQETEGPEEDRAHVRPFPVRTEKPEAYLPPASLTLVIGKVDSRKSENE